MPKKNNSDDLLGEDSLPFDLPESESEDLADESGEIQMNIGSVPDAAPELFPEASAPPAVGSKENYVVLARRYRPQTFDEIVGQEHVQKALRGAMATGQVGHAYLFSGPRGTGKTSTARILAKALNCQNGGPRPDPCGRCDSCRTISAGSSLDVIEIDAASNTGVDNIRDLRTGVVLAPFSRFKVYIVDEVHMLSTQAFNALLKTLEEPPSQVVFVLATTELQKVPETIVSRCQSFMFRRFSTTEIAKQLGSILNSEIERRKLTIDPEDRERILDLIARNAEGGMRDAQVALDQVLVLAHDKLDFESVRRFLGHVRVDVLDSFARHLHESRTEELLLLIDELVNTGQDLERFVKNFADYLRDLLIIRTAPEKPELVSVSEERYGAMRQVAEALPIAFLLNIASVFLKLAEELKFTNQARFLLEFVVIKLTRVDVTADVDRIVDRIDSLEKQISSGEKGATPVPSVKESAPSASQYQASPAVAAAPVLRREDTVATEEHNDRFDERHTAQAGPQHPGVAESGTVLQPHADVTGEQFLGILREKTADRNRVLHMTLLDTQLISFSGTAIVLGVSSADSFSYGHLTREQNQTIIKEIAREITGKSPAVRIERTAPVSVAQPQKTNESALDAASGEMSARTESEFAKETSREPENPVEEAPEMDEVYYPPEVRELMETRLRGPKLVEYIEKHADLKDVFLKVKEVFKVDDSQFTFRMRV